MDLAMDLAMDYAMKTDTTKPACEAAEERLFDSCSRFTSEAKKIFGALMRK
jgi:hypothetical protein